MWLNFSLTGAHHSPYHLQVIRGGPPTTLSNLPAAPRQHAQRQHKQQRHATVPLYPPSLPPPRRHFPHMQEWAGGNRLIYYHLPRLQERDERWLASTLDTAIISLSPSLARARQYGHWVKWVQWAKYWDECPRARRAVAPVVISWGNNYRRLHRNVCSTWHVCLM